MSADTDGRGDWRHGPLARLVDEPAPRSRTEAGRDRDRILYSSAFGRLAAVSQVVSRSGGHLLHNRMAHSIKVAQFARRLAESFQSRFASYEAVAGLDPEAAEAAALAHDLGHPPYGHLGEAVLNGIADQYECGGFEGNAQSFRVVTRLALRAIEYNGLNLTRATLNGLLKYPWLRGPLVEAGGDESQRAKWGAYDDDEPNFDWVRFDSVVADVHAGAGAEQRTLEACLMDWADDVTYAVHDVEDFYKAGLIRLDRLVSSDQERTQFFDSFLEPSGSLRHKFARSGLDKTELKDALDNVVAQFSLGLDRPYDGSYDLRALLRVASSALIGQFFEAIEPSSQTAPTHQSFVAIDKARLAEVAVLKELLWFYVINRPSLAAVQAGQRRILKTLFDVFIEAAADDRDWRLFPGPVQQALHDGPAIEKSALAQKQRARIVIDYIAGMNEAETLGIFRTVTGLSVADGIG